jgi:cell division protein FtsI (penicillin-binding protein 3)
MEIKKQIMLRIWLVFACFLLFGLAIIGQIIRIQFFEGDKWRSKADSLTTDIRSIEASRGNIFSADGSLIATSIPIYEVRMDVKAETLTKEIFSKNLDSLAICLSELFKDRTKQEYKSDLRQARIDGDRYHLIQRNVHYAELQKLKTFPLFRMGKNRGGLVILQRNVRENPFRQLALRTIGSQREVRPVGLEAAYNSDLRGENGQRLMQRISGNVWMPINDNEEVEAKDGDDLITTLDVNIQDVAENALYEHLQKQNADHGCAVLMEVETGEIKAIANLSRTKDGSYTENFNYVIGEATEPGSTMKLASLLVAMDDGLVELTDQVEVGDGVYYFSNQRMKDSHAPKKPVFTVLETFMKSSNVGISKLIYEHYSKHPQDFIDGLKKFHLHEKLGLEIPGEGKPLIRNTTDKYWSNVSLPWISIGYESKLTPLQILTLYNAVANNGRMVKPKFVSEIRNHGQVIKKFPTEVIEEKIVSQSTLDKAHFMLEAVVDSGTGRNVRSAHYRVAGKTGTAQIAHPGFGYNKSNTTYQASFVGYFPADKPKYSCMVVVYAPNSDVYYGGDVAAPVFRQIADRVFANNIELHLPFEKNDSLTRIAPLAKAGHQKDLSKVLSQMKIPATKNNADARWVDATSTENILVLNERKINEGMMPDVNGMGLRDALYVLENAGLRVHANGKGMVTKQSIEAGIQVAKGQQIFIELN